MFLELQRPSHLMNALSCNPFVNGGRCLTAAFQKNIDAKTEKAAFDALRAKEPDSKNGNYKLPKLKFADRVSLFFLGLALIIPVINIIINIAWQRFLNKDQMDIATKKGNTNDSFSLRNMLNGVENCLVSDLLRLYHARNVHLFYQMNPSNGPVVLNLYFEKDQGSSLIKLPLQYKIEDKESGPLFDFEIIKQLRRAVFRNEKHCADIDDLLKQIPTDRVDGQFPVRIQELNRLLAKILPQYSITFEDEIVRVAIQDDKGKRNEHIGRVNNQQALLRAAFDQCIETYFKL